MVDFPILDFLCVSVPPWWILILAAPFGELVRGFGGAVGAFAGGGVDDICAACL